MRDRVRVLEPILRVASVGLFLLACGARTEPLVDFDAAPAADAGASRGSIAIAVVTDIPGVARVAVRLGGEERSVAVTPEDLRSRRPLVTFTGLPPDVHRVDVFLFDGLGRRVGHRAALIRLDAGDVAVEVLIVTGV